METSVPNVPSPNRTARKRVWPRILAATAVWLIAFLVPMSLYVMKPREWWNAASGQPVPSGRFLYLMFPATTNTPLFDAPNGKEIGILERALGNSHDELQASDWIEVPSTRESAWVRKGDLAYLPPPNATLNYVHAYQESLQARDPAGFWSASLDTSAAPLVVFKKRDDDGHEYFEYRIGNNGATPLSYRVLYGPGVGILGAANCLGASVLAIAAYFTVGIVQSVRKPHAPENDIA